MELQTPEEMLQRWNKSNCDCDTDTGYLCERCHDYSVVRQLMRELSAARATVAAGETAIKQLVTESETYRRERDAASHVIVLAGVVPVKDTHCRCEECTSVLESIRKAGYADAQ